MKFQEFMKKSHLMSLHHSYKQFWTPLIQDLRKKDFNLNDTLILLALFFETSKEVSPSQLERNLGIPKDQISQSLQRLEKKSLIDRRLAIKDRRGRFVRLPKQGRR